MTTGKNSFNNGYKMSDANYFGHPVLQVYNYYPLSITTQTNIFQAARYLDFHSAINQTAITLLLVNHVHLTALPTTMHLSTVILHTYCRINDLSFPLSNLSLNNVISF